MLTRRSLLAAGAAVVGWWRGVAPGMGSDDAPTDAACAEPDTGPMRDNCPQPPRTLLRVPAGGFQEAALGTSCWATDAGACCVDMIGPIYPTCALAVPAGAVVELDIADLGDVSDLRIDLRPDPTVADGPPRRSRRRGVRREAKATWRLEFAHPASPVRLPADLPPGAYVIDLFAYADGPRGNGDTSQGFRVVVAPETGPAGTPVSAEPPAAATPVEGAPPSATPVGAER